MKYLRHIILFSGILVIVAFFTRISRNALYDGFFSKIEELNTRNSQEWDRVQINLPFDNQECIVSQSDLQVQNISTDEAGFFTEFILQNRQSLSSLASPNTRNWLFGCLRNSLPGFAQAP